MFALTPDEEVIVGEKQGGWGVMRLFLVVAILAVFAVGIYRLADFFVSGADQPVDINIPPPPPPPAAFEKQRQ